MAVGVPIVYEADAKLKVLRSKPHWTLHQVGFEFKVTIEYAKRIIQYAVVYEVLGEYPDRYGRYAVCNPLSKDNRN